MWFGVGRPHTGLLLPATYDMLVVGGVLVVSDVLVVSGLVVVNKMC